MPILARLALTYCPPEIFDQFWQQLTMGLVGGGIFMVDFLGPRTDYRDPQLARAKMAGSLSILNRDQQRALFADSFEVLASFAWTGGVAKENPYIGFGESHRYFLRRV